MMLELGEEEQEERENEKKHANEEVENEADFTPRALNTPTDLITRIFSQLDCIDLLHCSLVCKQWYIDSAELRDGWKSEYLEACSLFGLNIRRETHPPSTTCSIRGLHSWCP